MHNVRRMYAVLIFAALLLAADARCAWACSCASPSATPLEAKGNRPTIFAGRVTAVTILDPNSYALFRSVAVTVDVSEVWKGNVGSSIVIGTSRDRAGCGYDFVEGQEYLIYAFEYEGQLVTGICERTRPLAGAQADLAVLGEAQVPITAPTPLTTATPSATPQTTFTDVNTTTSPASNVIALVAVGGIGVLVVMFAGIALRRFFRVEGANDAES